MTDDERALLILCSRMVVALLKAQYGRNISAAHGNPVFEAYVEKTNDSLLESAGRMAALTTKVHDPHVPADERSLVLFFKKEILNELRKELDKTAELYQKMNSEDVVESLLKVFGVSEEQLEGLEINVSKEQSEKGEEKEESERE